jgi:hypothetical protein
VLLQHVVLLCTAKQPSARQTVAFHDNLLFTSIVDVADTLMAVLPAVQVYYVITYLGVSALS